MNAQTIARRSRNANSNANAETTTLSPNPQPTATEPQAEGETTEAAEVEQTVQPQPQADPIPTGEPKADIPTQTMRRVQSDMTAEALLKLASPVNRLAEKQKLMATASASLDNLAKLQGDSDVVEGKAAEITASVAFDFYNGMANGVISLEEVTNLLGTKFGWKKKGDAKNRAASISEQSKTPFGFGDAIRQRVQRAVKADAYVSDPSTGDNFFKELPVELVEGELDRVDNGELSIWAFYDNLQKARAKARTDNGDGPVALQFDVRKLAKLVGGLSEAGTIDAIAGSENVGALIVVYSALRDSITNVVEALVSREDADVIFEAVKQAPPLQIA